MRNTNELLRIVVAVNAEMLRAGLTVLLRRINEPRVNITEVASYSVLTDIMQSRTPDLVIIDPAFDGAFHAERFKQHYRPATIKLWALISALTDTSVLAAYDGQITFLDTTESLTEKLRETFTKSDDDPFGGAESLSLREREVLVCVVQGLTNKEIAERLYLSIHTIITHRRNIARKLQIHSTSGLTIYAIVNKLVDIEDVKM